MAEYIFKEAKRSSYLTANTNEIITTFEKKERIVRCRDCKHGKRSGTICRHRRFAMRETEFDIVYVEPNGFCAWGERRDDA